MERYQMLMEKVLAHVKTGLPEIYCDMDDVLVDFSGHIHNSFGAPIADWPNKEWKKKIVDTEKYWETIPPRPDARHLMEFILKFDPWILTAYASWDMRSIKAKREWMHRQFNCPAYKVLVVERHEKKNYAKKDGKPSILIDDYLKNINEWEKAGGIGVLHVSATQTIDKLKTLGFN